MFGYIINGGILQKRNIYPNQLEEKYFCFVRYSYTSSKETKLKSDYPDTEKVLIQGIIDAFFEENGEIVLMDYKTDRVSSKEELIGRYSIQLDYYKEALESARNLPVSEKIIYSFHFFILLIYKR